MRGFIIYLFNRKNIYTILICLFDKCFFRALNDTKQVSREEIHPKEIIENSVKMPSIEEKEDDEAIGIDFSLKNETVAICVVTADKSLLENAEAKKE